MEDVFKLMEREQNRDPLKSKLVELLEQNHWSENVILKTEREQQILHEYLVDGKSVAEIAESHGISDTRVRQIKDKANARLIYYLHQPENPEPEPEEKEDTPLKFDFDVLLVMQLPDESRVEEVKQILSTHIADLNLSVRTSNCLRAGQMEYLRDVVKKMNPAEFLKIRNFGHRSRIELEAAVYELGLKWLGNACELNPVPLVRRITLTTAYALANFSWEPETLKAFRELGIHTIDNLLMSRKTILARNLPFGQLHIIEQRLTEWGLKWK